MIALRRRGWPHRLPASGARALIASAITVLASFGTGGVAMAAIAPAPVSLTDITVHGGSLTALLTVRASGTPVSLPAGSVTATVGNADAPVTLQPVTAGRRATTLLVDTSGSMGASGMATVAQAVNAFLASAPPDVLVGLVSFSDRPHALVAPTTDRGAVRRAVASLKSSGETTLYDGIFTAIAQLGTIGDRSFVLLSDGGDTRSRHTLSQAAEALTSSGVRAEVVGFKTDESQDSVLTGLAQAGNGSVASATNPTAVDSAFTAAARALSSQVRVQLAIPKGLSGRQQVTVTAHSGNHYWMAGRTVDLGAATAVDTAPSSAPATPAAAPVAPAAPRAAFSLLGMPWQLAAALAAVFLGVVGLVLALVSPMLKSARTKRVDSIEHYVNGTTPAAQGVPVSPSQLSNTLVELGEKVMEGRESTSRTMALLERADLPWRAGEWAVLRVVAVVVGIAGGLLLLHASTGQMVFGVLAGVVAGLLLPSFILRFAARRRVKQFEAQLPDVLNLVASSLSTGFSLLQALDAVARDAAQPAAKEFSRALAETRIGADVDESLERMAERMDSENLRWTGMAIRIQRQVGGNLAETLRTTAGTLRERESLRRQVRALSAEGKLSAYILIALPIGLFLYMNLVNHDYVSLLWTNLIGIGMLVAAGVSLVLGIFWMRKVVDVEV
ncbi:type II secretion system F family protein [Oryzihumus leptocrescens]|uniref:Tight adherence protein B n=1 Tax=Oryzihumus leptocrescens TaxID=297536 RepID=A0A542ZGV5_9MICO|nr:type II secretion system F family protein [Oryzihumus leptocrescens]TQL59430.1 tight adherence protein B [Oryzihumus leptocrescens]